MGLNTFFPLSIAFQANLNFTKVQGKNKQLILKWIEYYAYKLYFPDLFFQEQREYREPWTIDYHINHEQ